VVITDAGYCHLCSALGTDEFLSSYVQNKVSSWVGEMEKLSEIAITQPQAAIQLSHMYSYIAGRTLLRQCPCPQSFSIHLMKF